MKTYHREHRNAPRNIEHELGLPFMKIVFDSHFVASQIQLFYAILKSDFEIAQKAEDGGQ